MLSFNNIWSLSRQCNTMEEILRTRKRTTICHQWWYKEICCTNSCIWTQLVVFLRPCSFSGKHWQALHQGCSAPPVWHAGEVQTQHLPVHQHCQQCGQIAPGWRHSPSHNYHSVCQYLLLEQVWSNLPAFSSFSQASRVLEIPPILTEQYPKGLGPTVPELGAADLPAHAKTSFTMMIEEVEKELQALGNPKQAILCGIEAHACIAVRPHDCFCSLAFNNDTISFSACSQSCSSSTQFALLLTCVHYEASVKRTFPHFIWHLF